MPRLDGWVNLLKGWGTRTKDPKQSTRFYSPAKLTREECEALYAFNGLAQRIVDIPVHDMAREGFVVNGDTENAVVQYLSKIGFDSALPDLLTWDRLFGGAVMVLFINDGGNLEQPLKPDSITSIDGFRVYDRYEVDKTSDVETDPKSPRFGDPVLYRITSVTGASFYVHYSRAIELAGTKVSNRQKIANAGFGFSILDRVFEGLRAYGAVLQSLEEIVDSFELRTVSISGLMEAIAEGNEKALYERLELFEMGRHVLNTMLLDENEKFEKHASSVAGLPDIVEKFFDRISTDAGVPVRILLGRQTLGGLEKSGSAETRDWYDYVASIQKIILTPIVERVVFLSMKAKKGPTNGKIIEDWSITFNSLWQPTAEEDAGIRKTQSETDRNYIDSSVLSPDEVALSRFGGDSYSTETKISEQRIKDIESGESSSAGEGGREGTAE